MLLTKEKNYMANLSILGAGETLVFLEAWTATAHKHNRHYKAECHHNCSLKVPTSWAQLSLDSNRHPTALCIQCHSPGHRS